MGAFASIGVLLDTASSLQSFVYVFVGIYVIMILAHIILSSWIQLPYSRTTARVQEFLNEVCSPYLGLFRGRIPTLGPLDLSPIVAVFVLVIASRLVIYLIGELL